MSGVVVQHPDGSLEAVSPGAAKRHLAAPAQPPMVGRDIVQGSARVSQLQQHGPARSPIVPLVPRFVASRVGIAALGLVLAAITLLQCWRYQPLSRPMSGDDQVYFFISERAAAGVPPHVSLVDHKHQLTALLSAAAMSAGRRLGIDDVIAARALSILVALTAVLGTFALATTLTGHVATGAIAALALLGFRTVFLEAAIGFRTQLFMMAFAVLAHLAFARSRVFAAGLLAAAAFLCWQPAALVGLSMLAVLLATKEKRPRRVCVLVAGGLTAVALYQAYFVWHGAVAEQVRQAYLMNATADGPRMPYVMATVRFLFGKTGGDRTSEDYLTIAMIIGLAALGVRSLVRRRGTTRKLDSAWRAVVLSAIGAIAFTFINHQAYPDRFFYLPYVALTAAALTAGAATIVRKPSFRALVHIAVATVLLTVALKPVPHRGSETTLDAQRKVARAVGALARTRGGGVWAVGRPDLLAFNHMDNWTNIGAMFPRVRSYLAQEHAGSAYRPLRDGDMPGVIVISRLRAPQETMPWLPAEYDRLRGKPWAKQSFAVYVRRGTSESPHAIGGIGCGLPALRGAAARPERVQATDALIVLRAALGLIECRGCVCDADGSGSVTTADALRVLAYAAGTSTSLQCPACSGIR